MSLSYRPLTPIRVEDPLTNVGLSAYAVLSGGDQYSFKAVTSTSVSTSNINFSAPPPSGVLTDRKVLFSLPVRIIFNGTITTNNSGFTPSTSLLNAGGDAPRAYPLSSAIDVLQVTINNQNISINMADTIQPLIRYNIDGKLRTRQYSETPTYPDQSQNYSDLTGTARNPLGNFGNTSKDDTEQRGAFAFTVVNNAAVSPTTGGVAASATVDFVITEMLYLSPFYWGNEDNQAFYNIQNMDFTINFLSNSWCRFWSHNNIAAVSGSNQVTSVINSATVQFNAFSSPAFSYPQANPLLHFRYITPNLLSKQNLNMSSVITHPYFETNRFTTAIGTLTYASGPQIFRTNTVVLSSIPRRAYILARPATSVLYNRCDITDSYLAISNLSVQWCNAPTLFATATQQQLYQMNCDNYGDFTWTEFTGGLVNNSSFPPVAGNAQYGTCGAPLCFSFGDQLQLEPNQSPGMIGQYQIQVQVTLQNKNVSTAWDNLQMELVLIVINEGTFTTTGMGNSQTKIGVLSEKDVLDSQTMPGINYRRLESVNGGDFLSSLRDFGSKIHNFLRETKAVSTIASQIPHPVAQGIAKVANVLGYGENMHGMDMDEEGGARHHRMGKKHMQKALMY